MMRRKLLFVVVGGVTAIATVACTATTPGEPIEGVEVQPLRRKSTPESTPSVQGEAVTTTTTTGQPVQETPSTTTTASCTNSKPLGTTITTTTEYGVWLAATIIGEEASSQVRVRPIPDIASDDGSYGLVGDTVAVLAEHVTSSCIRWYKVHFPKSQWVGWIQGSYIQITP